MCGCVHDGPIVSVTYSARKHMPSTTHTHTHTCCISAAVRPVRPDSLAAPALYLPQTIHLRRPSACVFLCERDITKQHSNSDM